MLTQIFSLVGHLLRDVLVLDVSSLCLEDVALAPQLTADLAQAWRSARLAAGVALAAQVARTSLLWVEVV